MTHVMVDLQTWGTRPGAALRSIAAAVFDPETGVCGAARYTNIDTASCEQVGLHVDPDTVAWWAAQSDKVQARLLTSPTPWPLDFVLRGFTSWWSHVGGDHFWSHGANFDEVLLQAAYHASDLPPPWKPWEVRCSRTVIALGGLKRRWAGVPRIGLDYVESQAEDVAAALKALKA